jgi:hypothetical protein
MSASLPVLSRREVVRAFESLGDGRLRGKVGAMSSWLKRVK